MFQQISLDELQLILEFLELSDIRVVSSLNKYFHKVLITRINTNFMFNIMFYGHYVKPALQTCKSQIQKKPVYDVLFPRIYEQLFKINSENIIKSRYDWKSLDICLKTSNYLSLLRLVSFHPEQIQAINFYKHLELFDYCKTNITHPETLFNQIKIKIKNNNFMLDPEKNETPVNVVPFEMFKQNFFNKYLLHHGWFDKIKCHLQVNHYIIAGGSVFSVHTNTDVNFFTHPKHDVDIFCFNLEYAQFMNDMDKFQNYVKKYNHETKHYRVMNNRCIKTFKIYYTEHPIILQFIWYKDYNSISNILVNFDLDCVQVGYDIFHEKVLCTVAYLMSIAKKNMMIYNIDCLKIVRKPCKKQRLFQLKVLKRCIKYIRRGMSDIILPHDFSAKEFIFLLNKAQLTDIPKEDIVTNVQYNIFRKRKYIEYMKMFVKYLINNRFIYNID